jgi:outer membrane protein OmpA-like peptidoglycan-associated protein
MARRPLLATLLLAFVAGSTLAQDIRLYRAGDAVDPREVAAILGKSTPGAAPMKMRSIRLLADAAAPAAQAQLVAAATQAAPVSTTGANDDGVPSRPGHAGALALPVQFAYDSAEVLPSARQQLDALAEGILMLPALQSVVIEGHTDASGSDQYNEQLSQRRAYAVKRYLVAFHRIDPARLRAVGLGKFAPLAGRDAYAAENRRVQFRGE